MVRMAGQGVGGRQEKGLQAGPVQEEPRESEEAKDLGGPAMPTLKGCG